MAVDIVNGSPGLCKNGEGHARLILCSCQSDPNEFTSVFLGAAEEFQEVRHDISGAGDRQELSETSPSQFCGSLENCS